MNYWVGKLLLRNFLGFFNFFFFYKSVYFFGSTVYSACLPEILFDKNRFYESVWDWVFF